MKSGLHSILVMVLHTHFALKLRSCRALEYLSWAVWWSCDQACCWRWRAVEAACVVNAAAMKAKQEHQRSWYTIFYLSYLFPIAKRLVEWNVSSFWCCKLCFICCSPPKVTVNSLMWIKCTLTMSLAIKPSLLRAVKLNKLLNSYAWSMNMKV